jgi:Flp pilus assembly CpaE family ATPase
VLESLNTDAENILLVVNQSDGHSDFNRDSIEQNLRHAVAVQLPYEPKIVGEAVTRGTPFVVSHPDSGIGRAVRELAKLVAPDQAAAADGEKRKRRGIFGR